MLQFITGEYYAFDFSNEFSVNALYIAHSPYHCAPGAFLVLAVLVAIMNAVGIKNRANKITEGCDGCCASCSTGCEKKEG